MIPTVTISAEIPADKHEALKLFLQRHPASSQDQAISSAIDLFLTSPYAIAIPPELLVDMVSICEWLRVATSEEVDPGVRSLYAEQARLVQAWLEEFVPNAAERFEEC